MRLALEEAELARGSADVPIGAVVVDADGQLIGRGHNEREATREAERAVSRRLKGRPD